MKTMSHDEGARVAHSTAQRCHAILKYVSERYPNVKLQGTGATTLQLAFARIMQDLESVMADSCWDDDEEPRE